jgi:hypothetical protein
MLDNLISSISTKQQGFLALLMGAILILGSLGKLGILQGILETIMIAAGIILLLWGLNKTDAYTQIKQLVSKK